MELEIRRLTVKQARLSAGLTQKEAAERLGVHRQTQSKWEKDASDMPMAKAYAFANVVGRKFEDISFMVEST
jgi:DNA-binding XRE family transcriptional regulator